MSEKKWSIEKEARLVELWSITPRMTVKAIGTLFDVSGASVSMKAALLGLPRRNSAQTRKETTLERTLMLFVNDRGYLRNAARRRDTTEFKLLTDIITTVINDRMIDAVLDDLEPLPLVTNSGHRIETR